MMDFRPEVGRKPKGPLLPHRVYQAPAPHPLLSLVVPAYNEEARLRETLPVMWDYLRRHFPGSELLVVDDGSTDATAEVVAAFARGRDGVGLISYRPNRGKGHAVRVGVLEARGQLVLFSDADLATPIEEVESLLARLRAGCPLAIGSRGVAGSRLMARQPWYRELAGRMLNLLVRCSVVPGVRDTQCGFKLFTREAARDLFGRAAEDGFSFDIEVLHLARRLGYEIAEVPVRWSHRDGSKVRMVRDSWRVLHALARVRRRHRRVRMALKD